MAKLDWYTYLDYRLISCYPTDPINKINRFKLPEYNNMLTGTRHFLFFTRPDLYLFNNNELCDGLNKDPFMYDMWQNIQTRPILKSLQTTGSDFNCAFIPIMYNYSKGYSPTDDEIESVERGETKFGHKIVYGKHNLKVRSANTISIPFTDDANLNLYKTIKTWCDYIEYVSIGKASPRRSDILNNILDYTSALYYIVTKTDMSEIIYSEKLVGLFPLNVPNSTFQYSLGTSIIPEYTINFRFSIRDKPMNPLALSEFNLVSGKGGDDAPNWSRELNMHGDPYVNYAYISKSGNKYYLRWCL